VLKAKVRYIKRDRRSAVICLEKVRDQHPASFEVERLLGNIYFEMGDTDKALSAYERCLNIDSSYPYIQFRYARLLQGAGRVDDAEAAYRQAMVLDPEFDEPAVELAQLLVEEGRAVEAIPVLERVALREGASEEAMVSLARLYVEAGRVAEGAELLEERRALGLLGREGRILLGRLYFESGELQEAEGVFEKLLQEEPDSPELVRVLAEIRLKSNDPADAKQYYERAIGLAPKDYRSYLGLFFASSAQFTTGVTPVELDRERQMALLDEASRLVAGYDFDGNYMLGLAFLSMESLDAAERHLLRARESNGNDRATLLNLANVYEKQQRLGESVRYLDQLYRLAPDDPTVLNFYGYVLAGLGRDLERAEEMVRRALDSDPDNGYYLDSLGWVYYQMGEYTRAVTELEKAAARVKDDPVILEHLGDAYAAQRNFDKAITAYEQSNRLQGGSDQILEKIQSATRRQ
jgi:tetratricopeptide (TPR) repeat protein